MKRGGPFVALILVAVGLAWTARAPVAGAVWRSAFVCFALGGVPVMAWAIRTSNPGPGTLLVIALALRLVVIPLAPTLSDDGYRYLWDGAATVAGQNPFATTPREAVREGLRPPIPLESLNSPDYHSVYPPVSQLGFAISVALGGVVGGWWIWKGLLVLVELLGLMALTRCVASRYLAWYAWHPAAVVEIAGQGHTEGLAIGLLSLGLAALVVRAWGRGGAWLAAAGWVKLWPFVLGTMTRRIRYWMFLVGGAIALALPWTFGADLGGVLASLGLYGGTFDFYSAPYTVVKSALWPFLVEDAGRVASIALGLFSFASVAVIATTRLSLSQKWSLSIIALTLLSPTLHPWHLLPALWASAMMPFRWAVPILWLVSVSPLTYLVYTGTDWAASAALAVGWGGALSLALLVWRGRHVVDLILARRGRQKWKRLRSILEGGPLRVLDLGCAEGYVGEAAAQEAHIVTLADLTDSSRVDLPFFLVNEEVIPHGDDSHDLTLLVFVLHHAQNPEALLREVARVSNSVLVWETLPTWWMPKPLLQYIDTSVNRIRPAHEMQPATLRTFERWERTFDTQGFDIVKTEKWGIFHPQALWLLERREDL